MTRKEIDSVILGCSSWSEFRARIAPLTKKEKGDLFERLMQIYLQTEPEFQAALEKVWLLSELPARDRRKIGLPRRDKGVDLVARHKNGTYWLIQAKERSDEEAALGWRALGTFNALRTALRQGVISCAVVAHTIARPIGDRKLMQLIGDFTEIGLDRLRKADWTEIHTSIIANAPVRPEPRTPTGRFAWQQAVIDKFVEYFAASHARARGQLPCGAGKTLLAYFIADALNANTVVIAVPSISLIKQTIREWLSEEVARRRLTDWLCVVSDDTVARGTDNIADERPDLGLPTTTDVAKIAVFLRQSGARKLIFTTYQSSARLATAAKRVGAKFDLIVLDEAHRTTGPRGREFATLLDGAKITARRRLFMTATERGIKNAGFDVLSMDERVADYGALIYAMSFKEAIERGIITPYEILTYFVTDNEVAELIKANRYLNLGYEGEEAVAARDVAAAVIVKRAMQEFAVKHPVVFTRSIAASRAFCKRQDLLNSMGFGPVAENYHVDSSMSAAEREDYLNEFIGAKRAVMFNARCLAEGLDYPDVDSVIFTAPKQSVVDIVQATGRALRKAPGKAFGYIVVPIIVTEGEKFDASDSEYGPLVKIVRALATQDERLREELMASYNDPVGKSKPRERLIRQAGPIPVGFGVSFDEFADAIEARAWRWRNTGYTGEKLPYTEGRAIASMLGITSAKLYFEYSKAGKLPENLPADPQAYYGDDFLGWGDWLGTGRKRTDKDFHPYKKSRALVRPMNISSMAQYHELARAGKLPPGVPTKPDAVYRGKGWRGVDDYLGNGRHMGGWPSYKEARAQERARGFTSTTEWRKAPRLPGLPSNPNQVYRDKGWKGWDDYLGLPSWVSYKQCSDIAVEAGIETLDQWNAWARSDKRPTNVPKQPWKVYAGKGWVSVAHFLRGVDRKRGGNFPSYSKAHAIVRPLELRSGRAYRDYLEKYKLNLPIYPEDTYAGKGWKGYGHFLGKT